MSLDIPVNMTRPPSSISVDNYMNERGSKTLDSVLVEGSKSMQESPSLEIPVTKLARALKSNSPAEIRKRFILEISKYFAFLFLFTFVTLGPRDERHSFLLTKLVKDATILENFADDHKTYLDVKKEEDFWNWLNSVYFPLVYRNTYGNGDLIDHPMSNNSAFLFLYNKVVGSVRIRQVRVKESNCKNPGQLRGYVTSCFPKYSVSTRDTSEWVVNGTTYEWNSENQLKGTSYWGELGFYDGGGYIVDFPSNDSVTGLAILDSVYKSRWIDERTRGVFVEYTIFNANLDLHVIVSIGAEFPATGGVIPSFSIRTQKLYKYHTTMEWIVLAAELMFVILLGYYVYEYIAVAQKFMFLVRIWSYVDLVNFVCFFIVIGLRIKHVATLKFTDFDPPPNVYVNFQAIGFSLSAEQNINAINGLLTYLKIFKYLQYFSSQRMLLRAIVRSMAALFNFFLIFFVIFLGFSFGLYIAMGRDVYDFSSIQNSMYTLFRATVGDFNFEEMRAGNRILGPAFFVTYTLICFLVLLNMFIAIITQTYDEEKRNPANLSSSRFEHAVLGFVKLKMNYVKNTMKKLSGWKQDIQRFDKDKDGKLSEQELEELKQQHRNDPEFMKLLNEADKNKDHELSEAETTELYKKIEEKRQEKLREAAKTAATRFMGHAHDKSSISKNLEVPKMRPLSQNSMDEQSILEYVKEEIEGKSIDIPQSSLEKSMNKIEKEVQQNKVAIEDVSKKIDEVLVIITNMNGQISDTCNSLSSNLSLSLESLQKLLKDKPT